MKVILLTICFFTIVRGNPYELVFRIPSLRVEEKTSMTIMAKNLLTRSVIAEKKFFEITEKQKRLLSHALEISSSFINQSVIEIQKELNDPNNIECAKLFNGLYTKISSYFHGMINEHYKKNLTLVQKAENFTLMKLKETKQSLGADLQHLMDPCLSPFVQKEPEGCEILEYSRLISDMEFALIGLKDLYFSKLQDYLDKLKKEASILVKNNIHSPVYTCLQDSLNTPISVKYKEEVLLIRNIAASLINRAIIAENKYKAITKKKKEILKYNLKNSTVLFDEDPTIIELKESLNEANVTNCQKIFDSFYEENIHQLNETINDDYLRNLTDIIQTKSNTITKLYKTREELEEKLNENSPQLLVLCLPPFLNNDPKNCEISKFSRYVNNLEFELIASKYQYHMQVNTYWDNLKEQVSDVAKRIIYSLVEDCLDEPMEECNILELSPHKDLKVLEDRAANLTQWIDVTMQKYAKIMHKKIHMLSDYYKSSTSILNEVPFITKQKEKLVKTSCEKDFNMMYSQYNSSLGKVIQETQRQNLTDIYTEKDAFISKLKEMKHDLGKNFKQHLSLCLSPEVLSNPNMCRVNVIANQIKDLEVDYVEAISKHQLKLEEFLKQLKKDLDVSIKHKWGSSFVNCVKG